jgi:hypothetical protein
VAVAYDTVCRSEELVSLLIEDIESSEDGNGGDPALEDGYDRGGRDGVFVADDDAAGGEWLEGSRLKSGPLFARVVGSNGVGIRRRRRSCRRCRVKSGNGSD